jgi:hypothetical protein
MGKGDAGELETEFIIGQGGEIKPISITKPAEAVFNIEYLERAIKEIGNKEDITLSLLTNEPLRVSHEKEGYTTEYYLAPYMTD